MRRFLWLFFILLATGAHAQNIQIGETSILTAGDGGNGNLLLAQGPYVLSQAATIDSLSFYVTTAAGRLILGVYTNGSNGPRTLLAKTPAFTAMVGWNTQNVSSSMVLQPGSYWLAYLPSSNNLGFVKQNNSGLCYYGTRSFSNGMPTLWPARDGPGCTPTSWSFYATLTPTAPPPPPVSGQCGAANGVPVSSAPSSGLCLSGSASPVAGGAGNPWTWTCQGMNGGANASCSAPYLQGPVNGVCGTANGATFPTAPTMNLCSVGAASSVSGTGPWSWSCAGSNGGITASCSANLGASSSGITFTPLHQYFTQP